MLKVNTSTSTISTDDVSAFGAVLDAAQDNMNKRDQKVAKELDIDPYYARYITYLRSRSRYTDHKERLLIALARNPELAKKFDWDSVLCGTEDYDTLETLLENSSATRPLILYLLIISVLLVLFGYSSK